jgi:hypothetical protein
MLAKRANVDVTHVPYKGADALNDLLSGRVQFMFATIPSVIQHIEGGQAAAARGHQRKAIAFTARRADSRRKRFCELRSRFMVRLFCAQGDPPPRLLPH